MGQLRNYRYYLSLSKEDLKVEVYKLSREELIEWLCWNDRNGIYRDEDSINELGRIMTLEEGREIMIRQISD